MLTVATRIKNITFLILGSLAIAFVGYNYADLGRYVGFKDYYVVRVDLATAGGLTTNADVTYRGTSVGRVGELNLTGDGLLADLRIKKSAPKIPSNTAAVVANRSAIGEQYIDLRPATAGGPYLAAGSIIPRTSSTTPAPVTELLTSLNEFAASVPQESLRTVVSELGRAFNGQGPNLRSLLDNSHTLTRAANDAFPETEKLIVDGETVLRTQNQEAASLKKFGHNARLLARQLRESDPAFRELVSTAPGAAGEFAALVRDLDPSLSVLLANLLTTSDILHSRTDGLEHLLAKLPAAVSAARSMVNDKGRLNFGMVTTFFNPMPCTQGYGGTKYRNGLDTSSGPPLNTSAQCSMPASSGVNVRGSANAPHGSMPEPARPGSLLNTTTSTTTSTTTVGATGMPGALGLPALAPSSVTDMGGLLGLGGRP
ncbi:MlaD family protein [Spirillospora sp. CA-294931]|uniref:MlaD family protein n=1 Tax=Spirillospora sp. CA-294931 TaxID=3240042 RepID=UPI003D8A5BAB